MAYENILMSAQGSAFAGWTRVSVTADWGTSLRTFDVQVTEVGAYGASPFSKWNFPPSTAISLIANGSLLLAGFVDDYMPSGDAESHSVTIRGRGTSRGFVDCSCKHETGLFENKTALQIAQELAAPFGATIKVLASAADAAGEVIPWFQIRRGSSPWAELMRILPQKGITMTGQADGSIALMRCEPTTHAGGLIQGQNIKRLAALLSDAEVFSDYEVIGQGEGTEDTDLEVDATESGGGNFGLYRHTEVVDTAATDQQRAQQHAKWLSLRAAGLSRKADLTVVGFRDEGGRLWEPGNMVFVLAPWLKIEQTMMIKTANFVQDLEEGSITNLSLVDPATGGGPSGGPSNSGSEWNVFGSQAGGKMNRGQL